MTPPRLIELENEDVMPAVPENRGIPPLLRKYNPLLKLQHHGSGEETRRHYYRRVSDKSREIPAVSQLLIDGHMFQIFGGKFQDRSSSLLVPKYTTIGNADSKLFLFRRSQSAREAMTRHTKFTTGERSTPKSSQMTPNLTGIQSIGGPR